MYFNLSLTFRSESDADLIFRTSDGIEGYIHQEIVGQHSVVWRDAIDRAKEVAIGLTPTCIVPLTDRQMEEYLRATGYFSTW